ncbi:MAG: hypothetical protein ACREXG_05955 [Polaromonas sp.]
MRVRAEQLRAFDADGFITKRCAFGGAANKSNVLGHGPILQRKLELRRDIALVDVQGAVTTGRGRPATLLARKQLAGLDNWPLIQIRNKNSNNIALNSKEHSWPDL